MYTQLFKSVFTDRDLGKMNERKFRGFMRFLRGYKDNYKALDDAYDTLVIENNSLSQSFDDLEVSFNTLSGQYTALQTAFNTLDNTFKLLNGVKFTGYNAELPTNIDTSEMTDMSAMFLNGGAALSIPLLDMTTVTNTTGMFTGCTSLVTANLKGLKQGIDLSPCIALSKESMLYIINNAQTVTAETIIVYADVLALLTPEEIAVGTAKGWTIQSPAT